MTPGVFVAATLPVERTVTDGRFETVFVAVARAVDARDCDVRDAVVVAARDVVAFVVRDVAVGRADTVRAIVAPVTLRVATLRADVVVLETGLGGRFDATNVIKSNLCAVITHIDLDHTDRLGSTKDKIAYEKAGIIKPGCPVVTCEGYEAIKDKADECNSLLLMVAPFEDTSELALKGSFQQENLSLALAAIRLVFPAIAQEDILKGLHEVRHPCRFEFRSDKMLLIDGAHNPNGALALRDSLEQYFPDKKRRFVFGCLKTKDYTKMMEILFTKNDEIYFCHFNNANSVTVEELQSKCPYPSKEFVSLDRFEVRDDTITIVCGSFYMLHEILLSG